MATERKQGSRARAGTEGIALAWAAMAAIEPVLALLLRIGVTSPEAESIFRSLFVHAARDWLAEREGGEEPTDVRVSLVTSVHRTFVRRILAEPLYKVHSRGRRGYLAGRLLAAWQKNRIYQDAHGNPSDLPERGPAPSFASLAATAIPGVGYSSILQELLLAGAVESLGGHRVRLRTRHLREPGLQLRSVSAFGQEAQSILQALTDKLLNPQSTSYGERTSAIAIAEDRFPLAQRVVAERADAFLRSLETELAAERARGRRGSRQIVLHVIQTGKTKKSGRGKKHGKQ